MEEQVSQRCDNAVHPKHLLDKRRSILFVSLVHVGSQLAARQVFVFRIFLGAELLPVRVSIPTMPQDGPAKVTACVVN